MIQKLFGAKSNEPVRYIRTKVSTDSQTLALHIIMHVGQGIAVN